MRVQGIRGAITVTRDQPEDILSAVQELLSTILAANPGLLSEDIASIIFTMTDDLSSTYPAKAARQMGWVSVPLMCMREIPVPDGLPYCIRVLLHWNTDLSQSKVQHVYLRDAVRLRPDLARQHPKPINLSNLMSPAPEQEKIFVTVREEQSL
jgi:chorismate mutase